MSYNQILITKKQTTKLKLLKYLPKSKIKTSHNNKNKQVLHLFVWYSNKLKWESNLTGDTSHEFLIGEEGKMKNKKKEPIMENDSWSSIPAKIFTTCKRSGQNNLSIYERETKNFAYFTLS